MNIEFSFLKFYLLKSSENLKIQYYISYLVSISLLHFHSKKKVKDTNIFGFKYILRLSEVYREHHVLKKTTEKEMKSKENEIIFSFLKHKFPYKNFSKNYIRVKKHEALKKYCISDFWEFLEK